MDGLRFIVIRHCAFIGGWWGWKFWLASEVTTIPILISHPLRGVHARRETSQQHAAAAAAAEAAQEAATATAVVVHMRIAMMI